MSTREEAGEALLTLRKFVGPLQLITMADLSRGEEGQFFIDKMVEMARIFETMPKTYDQQGLDDPIAHLHYFRGGFDWYIFEKDCDPDGEGQVQAYGYADLGYPECGYISLVELMEAGVEIDLHFAPTPLSKLREKHERVRL